MVPTVGRPCLTGLLSDLARQRIQPDAVYVVDDRARADAPLDVDTAGLDVVVLRGGGRGPAAARNKGWRAASTEWIAFLDDDVRLPDDWSVVLVQDLRQHDEVAAVQGRIVVPLAADRKPTDWERSTAGLEGAKWATADMAYRRSALEQAGGFDERFPRAYREDAELALRVRRGGGRLVVGERQVLHPVRQENFWVSVRVQKGNADDALLRAVYGKHWRELAECPPGRFKWHLATVSAAGLALGGALLGRRRTALAGLAGWLGLTADFAWRRIAPGPRTSDELQRMTATSAVLPFVAVWHRVRGTWRHRGSTEWPGPIRAVLFDRDGTLVHDVPYNGDPAKVMPVAGAEEAVARLREAGLRIGVVTNQSGIGRGLISAADADAVNRRVDELLGPFDTWQLCPHVEADGCDCRKPAAGLVLAAAERLGVRPEQVVVVGDIGSDVAAARAAGARSVLVPNGKTRPEEIVQAGVVAPDLGTAVDLVLEHC
ncbi:HAD-IIIA family hydrolase [Kribbella flavida]|uniref:HAD-IIIA family hydrolase n=1 Tax=Kribbella flavida TaxID=182640 RepID=UPI00192C6F0D|nr:HAD-IIIA family hydrolase [Kribbella flavida]